MTGQYSPWTNARFGFPRKDAPAFQREWKPMNSSGVEISNADRILVNPPSSVGVSGTIYLWGVSFAVPSTAPHAGKITDDNGLELLTVVATQNGPYFLQLTTPIKVTDNSGLLWDHLAGSTTSWVTPLYTTSHVKFE